MTTTAATVVFFFDSHGALWRTAATSEHGAVSFGPTGAAIKPYCPPGRSAYSRAKEAGVLVVAEDEFGWDTVAASAVWACSARTAEEVVAQPPTHRVVGGAVVRVKDGRNLQWHDGPLTLKHFDGRYALGNGVFVISLWEGEGVDNLWVVRGDDLWAD